MGKIWYDYLIVFYINIKDSSEVKYLLQADKFKLLPIGTGNIIEDINCLTIIGKLQSRYLCSRNLELSEFLSGKKIFYLSPWSLKERFLFNNNLLFPTKNVMLLCLGFNLGFIHLTKTAMSMDSQEVTLLVLLDLSRAFDSILITRSFLMYLQN